MVASHPANYTSPLPPPLAPEGAPAHPFSMRVVQKFGGTSVADAERIRHVAGQVAGRVGHAN